MTHKDLTFTLLAAAAKLTRRLDGSLSSIKGISFSEFQLLSSLEAHPASAATRVNLAQAVGLTPSGVTRALKPLEKLGFVETIKDGRDARRSLAKLTEAGLELVSDATGVVNDTLESVTPIQRLSDDDLKQLTDLLRELAN